MKEDDKMAESLDGSNWDGPGSGGGQNGAGGTGSGQNGQNGGGDGAPEEQSLPVRVGRLEGEFKHLATKADLEKGLSKLGTELRGEMHKQGTELRKEIDGVKDDLSEKIEAQGKELAGISGQLKTLIWVIGVVGGGLVGVLFTLALG